jgi:hypothetical protein
MSISARYPAAKKAVYKLSNQLEQLHNTGALDESLISQIYSGLDDMGRDLQELETAMSMEPASRREVWKE